MSCRGLTLSEVLIAMLLATAGAAGLFRSAQSVLQYRMRSEQRLEASQLAEHSLEEFLAVDPETLAAGDSIAAVYGRRGLFRIHRRVEPGSRENLWHLAVTVSSASGSEVSLHTLLRRPWS